MHFDIHNEVKSSLCEFYGYADKKKFLRYNFVAGNNVSENILWYSNNDFISVFRFQWHFN